MAGKYQPFLGKTVEGDCLSCPSNSVTSDTGEDAIADCKCKIGWTGPDGGPCVNAFIASPDCPFVDCDTVTCKCDTVTCKTPKLACRV